MLLSQRIAKDVKFLNAASAEPKNTTMDMFDLRMRIINATKIIVPQELFHKGLTYGESLTRYLTKGTRDDFEKKAHQYNTYCNLPFPSLFIENETGGMLVEALPSGPNHCRITSVDDDGGMIPIQVYCKGFGLKDNDVFQPNIDIDYVAKEKYLFVKQIQDHLRMTALVNTYMVYETLLFLNVRNTVLHKYVPTKKENAAVPKPLQVKYVYHILDVFRDITRYDSMDQITEQIKVSGRSVNERRMHVVRGHFKQLKSGLYWWSDHMRNRHNRETVGEVEKDYRIVA